jgi:hypothetical protein
VMGLHPPPLPPPVRPAPAAAAAAGAPGVLAGDAGRPLPLQGAAGGACCSWVGPTGHLPGPHGPWQQQHTSRAAHSVNKLHVVRAASGLVAAAVRDTLGHA